MGYYPEDEIVYVGRRLDTKETSALFVFDADAEEWCCQHMREKNRVGKYLVLKSSRHGKPPWKVHSRVWGTWLTIEGVRTGEQKHYSLSCDPDIRKWMSRGGPENQKSSRKRKRARNPDL